MARVDETGKSVTFMIGIANVLLALIWGGLYGSGFLSSSSMLSSQSMIFYVLTMFLAGFGIIFPFVEKTYSERGGINQGLGFSVVALLLYAAYIGAFIQFGTLEFKTLLRLGGAA